jgi:uncharacterized oxidoreductase
MSFLANNNSNSKSTILITGGASGIGLALAEQFLALGHVVIAAGRRQTVLDKAQEAHPNLKTIQGDISSDAGRIALFEKATREFPDLNVLVNNAGVNPTVGPLKDTTEADWSGHKDNIEINLIGSIHMSILFIPHLITKSNALIANVTSILAFFQFAPVSTYGASKAALHSFTLSLRHQLKDTSIKVVEIVPPGVETDMCKDMGGMDSTLYTSDVVFQLLNDVKEISYEGKYIRASRDELQAVTDMYHAMA